MEPDVKLCEHSHNQYLLFVQDLRVLGLDGVLISAFLSKLLELGVCF